MEDEIFIKAEGKQVSEVKKPKKKRVLTEKQLEGLAKGRAKMAEKRRLKKELENKRKELAALDTKVVKDNQKEVKASRGRKKKIIEEQKVIEEDFITRKKRADKSSSKFNKLKTGAIKNLKSTEEMNEFETIMKGVSKDMERNPEKLYNYLREHGDRLIGKAKKKLQTIKEEPKEIKPSIKLHIDEL